jgi:hypothetical protein
MESGAFRLKFTEAYIAGITIDLSGVGTKWLKPK